MAEDDEYWLFVNGFTGHDWEYGAYGKIEEDVLMEVMFGEVVWFGEVLTYGEMECVLIVILGRICSFLN